MYAKRDEEREKKRGYRRYREREREGEEGEGDNAISRSPRSFSSNGPSTIIGQDLDDNIAETNIGDSFSRCWRLSLSLSLPLTMSGI